MYSSPFGNYQIFITGADFFHQPCLVLAKALLGKVLVRKVGGELVRGRIVETESYVTGCRKFKNSHGPGGDNVKTQLKKFFFRFHFCIQNLWDVLLFQHLQPGAWVLCPHQGPGATGGAGDHEGEQEEKLERRN